MTTQTTSILDQYAAIEHRFLEYGIEPTPEEMRALRELQRRQRVANAKYPNTVELSPSLGLMLLGVA